MIPAKEFEGELWIKASDHHKEVKRAVEAEREECAKVCEEDQTQAMEWTGGSCPGGHFAKAIRARGQQ